MPGCVPFYFATSAVVPALAGYYEFASASIISFFSDPGTDAVDAADRYYGRGFWGNRS